MLEEATHAVLWSATRAQVDHLGALREGGPPPPLQGELSQAESQGRSASQPLQTASSSSCHGHAAASAPGAGGIWFPTIAEHARVVCHLHCQNAATVKPLADSIVPEGRPYLPHLG